MSQFGHLLNHKCFVHSNPLCSLVLLLGVFFPLPFFSFFFLRRWRRKSFLFPRTVFSFAWLSFLYFVETLSSQVLPRIPTRFFFSLLVMLQVSCSVCSTRCLFSRLPVFFKYLVILGYLLIYRWGIPLITLSVVDVSALSNCHSSLLWPPLPPGLYTCTLAMACEWRGTGRQTFQLLSSGKRWVS